MFSSGRGVILNLNIKKATIIAEVTEDDNKNYQAYLGGLVARCSGSLSIKNCTVDEYSVYTIKNTVDHAYSGGMVGYTGWVTTITNCINNGNVSASAENYAYSGGIVGHTDGITIITNCTNNGDISAISCSIDYYGEPCAGGIVGEVDHNETIASCISNCINNGNVSVNHLITQDSGEGYAGGIVGYVYDDAIISNCINNGDITATSTYNGGLAGGIVGYIFYTKCTITNCINSGRVEVNARYRSEGGIIAAVFNSETIIFKNCYSTTKRNGYDGDLCTASQLNSKEFYTDTLGWSESIWDFSELDVENGKCPKLK